MEDSRAKRMDRGLLVAIAVAYLVGLLCIASSVWEVFHPPAWTVVRHQRGVIGGFLAGPIFIGFATGELIHRLRHGPQDPGRHTR